MRGKEMLIAAIMFGGLGGYAWWSLPPGALDGADQRARIERRADYAGCPDAGRAARPPADRAPRLCDPRRPS